MIDLNQDNLQTALWLAGYQNLNHFLGYMQEHSKTQRALFHNRDIFLLIWLAGYGPEEIEVELRRPLQRGMKEITQFKWFIARYYIERAREMWLVFN